MVRKALFLLPLGKKRKLHSGSMNCSFCPCAAFCQQTNHTCQEQCGCWQGEVGWEQPWLGAAGHPVAPQGQWLMARWYHWPQKGAGSHVALQSGPGLGAGSSGGHRGVGGVRLGCPVVATGGHSPRLTAGALRGRGVEELGEETSLGKGVNGKVVI